MTISSLGTATFRIVRIRQSPRLIYVRKEHMLDDVRQRSPACLCYVRRQTPYFGRSEVWNDQHDGFPTSRTSRARFYPAAFITIDVSAIAVGRDLPALLEPERLARG